MNRGLRSKGLVTLLLTLTFAAGAAVGVAGDRMVAAEDTPPAAEPAGQKGRFTIEQYAGEIGLTESQRAQIAPILDDVMAHMEALAEEIRPRAMAIGEDAKARIKELLTPEQADKYEAILAERERAERLRKEAAVGKAPPGVDVEE